MSNNSLYSALEKFEWAHIPNSTFIMKYKFEEGGYSIVVSNLKDIFGENLTEAGIQQRFSDSNSHAVMKTKVIIKNIKHSLEEMINNTCVTEVSHNEKYLTIQLQFCVSQVSFLFNLEPALLSSQELRNHIIVPTISHTLFTQLENLALKKKINDLENRLNSSVSPQKPLVDYRTNSNFFNLYSDVSDTSIINAFLEVQNAMKNSFHDKEKLFELHKKHVLETSNLQQCKSSKAPVKREIADVSETKFEIKYEEEEEEETSQMPIDEIPVLPKVKKKKNLKF